MEATKTPRPSLIGQSSYTSENWLPSNIHHPTAAPNKTTSGAAPYDLSDVVGYTLALRNMLHGRLLLVTKEGRGGVAAVDTHTGDFIMLFAGSDVPFIVQMAEVYTKDNL